MSTIQVRNVPEPLHRALKARAAASGRSLSDYLLDELRVVSERPTMSDWLTMVAELPDPPATPPPPASDVIHAERRR